MRIVTFLTVVLFCIGCGEETMEEKINRRIAESVQKATGTAVDMDSLGAKVNEVFRDMDSVKFNKMKDVAVINFRELKPLFPNKLAGLKQQKITGETQSVLGITYSKVEASYGSGESRIDVDLTDSGGAGMLLTSMAAFTNFKVDKETERGSERTLDIDGNKAYLTEEMHNGSPSASLAVLINERFILNLSGDGMTGDDLMKAYGQMGIAELPEAKE